LCADASASYLPSRVGSFNVIDVATASVRQHLTTTVSPQALHWDTATLQLAGTRIAEPSAFTVEDLFSGASLVVYRLRSPSSSTEKTDDFPNGVRGSGATFSADGHQLAFWEAECLGRNRYEPTYCGTAQGWLVIVDLQEGSHRVLASGEATLDG